MILGLDLDNTIICYDGLFHQRGVELGCIPSDLAEDKETVSEYLKTHGMNDVWTRMQAEIYGPELHRAQPYPGAREFAEQAAASGVEVHIISHKTQFAAADPDTDLRECAGKWLRAQRFTGANSSVKEVYFAETRREKVARIAAVGCTHFVDDLPEVFDEPGFPSGTLRFLFDPQNRAASWKGGERIGSWEELREAVFK